MPRNIEIKARIDSVDTLLPLAHALAGPVVRELLQDDTFFHCPNGRLKLRAFGDGSGELIFYRRADSAGPKESFYVRNPVADPDTLRSTLALAWGTLGRVEKRRWLLLAGRTRIHLDRVVDLGDFLELEVVLDDAEPLQAGVEEAQTLMAALGILPQALVEGAYLDLLQRPAG
jgi:predicted adenylyl cyclase CyaB